MKKFLSRLFTFAVALSLLAAVPLIVSAGGPVVTPIIVSGGSGNGYHALYANGLPLLIEAEETSGRSNVKYDSNGDGTYDTEFRMDIDLSDYDVYGGGRDEDCSATSIEMTGGNVHYVIGGGHLGGSVNGNVTIDVAGGTVLQICTGCYGQPGRTSHVFGDGEVTVSGGEIGDLYGGGWAWGASSRSIMKNATVNVTGGTLNQVAGGWVGNGGAAEITDSFAVNISGGTIKTNVNASAYVDTNADKTVTITGGTLLGTISGAEPTNATDSVYKTALRFMDGSAKANVPVTALTTSAGYAYGLTDVVTDAYGRIFVYLPADTLTTAGVIATDHYGNTPGIKTLNSGAASGDLEKRAPAPVLTPGTVYRSSATEATVKLTSDAAADCYYYVSESATAPNTGNLSEWESGGALTADTSVSLTADGLTGGAQYIHVVAVNDEGDVGTSITFSIPWDYYYWENFESYPLGTTLASGDFSPLQRKYDGSGSNNQKVIQGSGDNTSQVLTLTSSSGTAADADIALESDFANSGKTYGLEFKAQPVSGSWPGEVRLLTGAGRGTFTNALAIEFRGGKIGAYIEKRANGIYDLKDYTTGQWYHVKVIVNTETKKYSIYVDGVRLAYNLEAIGDYTYLNITAGHSGNIRFDDLKIYETAPDTAAAPLLQSAATTTDGGKVILTFDKEMADPTGKHDQFAVTAGGSANTVTAAAMGTDGKTIELTLTTAIAYGQTVTAHYTKGTIAASDGGILPSFTGQAVSNNVPEPAYTLTAPDSITKNNVTATVTFSPASPVAAGTSVTATVSLTGKATAAGTHTVDLTSGKASLTADPQTFTVTTGQELTATPITKTFTMPSEAAGDFVLTHTFSLAAPRCQSAATSIDGVKVILTFDKDMANPAGHHNSFRVQVNGDTRSITGAALGSDGKTIELTLAAAVAYGESVTVSLPPNGGAITSADAVSLPPFDDTDVVNNVPVPTYTITVPALAGGAITPSAATATAGTAISLTVTPDSGKELKAGTLKYTVGTTDTLINESTKSFVMPAANVTVTAIFQKTPALYSAEIKKESGEKTSVPITVNPQTRTAGAEMGPGQFTSGETVMTMPSIPNIDTYTVAIPVSDLSTAKRSSRLTVKTPNGSITLPSHMLTGTEQAKGNAAQIAVGKGDPALFPQGVKATIGNRPFIRLTLSIDGKQKDWHNPGAAVTAAIPYTPTETELENLENIILWYSDGTGNAVTIPNGCYDAAAGAVLFHAARFGDYAVAYNKISFSDVAATAWYAKAVSFIAAREITLGTGGGKYSPEPKLTRAEFIVLMMRAYGIAPDANPTDNFSDAGNTWYTGYLGAAKRLGISAGVGNNRYAPNNPITRQEMFTLLYNAVKAIDQLPQGDSGKTLDDFTDAANVAPWAKEAMTLLVKTGTVKGSNGKLLPADATTRAEMAQALYNLLAR